MKDTEKIKNALRRRGFKKEAEKFELILAIKDIIRELKGK